MFRYDLCTVKRPKKTYTNGEVKYGTPEVIYEDVPCHLSVRALSPVNQSDSTATVLLDYVLFTDTCLGLTINKNDVITVTRWISGDTVELRAGESQQYPITTQTHCEKIKVA